MVTAVRIVDEAGNLVRIEARYKGITRVSATTMEELRVLWADWAKKENERRRTKLQAAMMEPDALGVTREGVINDCWVRALCNTAPEYNYDQWTAISEQYGYRSKPNAGIPVNGIAEFCKNNTTFKLFPSQWKGLAPSHRSLGKAMLPKRNIAATLVELQKAGGKWIVGITGHVFAVVDGKVIDKPGRMNTRKYVDMLIKVD